MTLAFYLEFAGNCLGIISININKYLAFFNLFSFKLKKSKLLLYSKKEKTQVENLENFGSFSHQPSQSIKMCLSRAKQ